MPRLLENWQLVGSRLLEWVLTALERLLTVLHGEGSNSGLSMAAALGEPYIVQHGEGATARNCNKC